MKLFDSHCHLTDARFEGDVAPVLDRAREAGVAGVVTIASDLDDADAALALASAHPDVWCSAGVHPHVAERATPAAFERLRRLAARPEVVALGETGLDFHYDNAPRDAQRAAFRRHLELAAELGLPVVVHSRDADDDTTAMLRDAPAGVRGVLHCFAGGAALLRAGLEAGWHVSFSGLVSFRRYDGGDLVRGVPGDRLLIETDSPYLAPAPHRGRRNEPALVRHVAEAVGRWRGESAADVAETTSSNAMRFYGLDAREEAP